MKSRSMMILSLKTIFFLYSAFSAVTVGATCRCHDVCPTYDRSYYPCWITLDRCPPSIYKIFIRYNITCNGGCSCNMFGCNCEACNCPGMRSLQSIGNASTTTNATNNATNNNCTDYYYYMNLTLAEKIAHFEESNCAGEGLTASDAMVRKIEALADTNRNGEVNCKEFNSAYAANITTIESFCTAKVGLNSTKAPATAPAGFTLKTSSTMGTSAFQTFLVPVFVTALASLFA